MYICAERNPFDNTSEHAMASHVIVKCTAKSCCKFIHKFRKYANKHFNQGNAHINMYFHEVKKLQGLLH